MNNIRISITGDLCPIGRVEENFLTENYSFIFNGVEEIFHNSDLSITNLECPLTNSDKKITKTGPHLKANPKVINGLKWAGFNLVTLANNHIMDYNSEGLDETLNLCKKNNIGTVGASPLMDKVHLPYFKDIKGRKIAVINFCENEWSTANNKRGGANPLNIVRNSKIIQETKKYSDFVIVIIHGGHEHYQLPSPRMVETYRFYAEQGASIIIGHHPHCVSGYEDYKGVPIFYSLGNFLFGKNSSYENWYWGIILTIDINSSNTLSWSIIPVMQSKKDFNLNIIKNEFYDEVINIINNLNSIILDEEKLLSNWEVFIKKVEMQYLNEISLLSLVPNRYLRSLCRKLCIDKNILRKRYLTILLNFIRCETHLDVLIKILDKKLRDKY